MSEVRVLGYLPYSHSPGPGWYPDKYDLNWEEAKFFLKFILMLGIYLLPTLALIFGLFKLLLRIGYHRIIFSTLAGILISFATTCLTTITGNYIALDLSTSFAGAFFGYIYGFFILPYYIKPYHKQVVAD